MESQFTNKQLRRVTMKKLVLPIVTLCILSLGCGIAFAGNLSTGGTLSGKHYTINLIGHKNAYNGNGDTSNGSTIFIPLKTTNNSTSFACEEVGSNNQVQFIDDQLPTFTNVEPANGVRINFKAGTSFDITDRDATDGSAEVVVPVAGAGKYITYDVYMRVLGKPNTCMDIDGYAYDQQQGMWFLSGHVDVNRTTGKSTFVKVTDLFDVWFCNVVAGVCDPATVREISVFDDVFDGYFWQIQNDGTRLVQIRLYPRQDS
jgi:hypothetical protein